MEPQIGNRKITNRTDFKHASVTRKDKSSWTKYVRLHASGNMDSQYSYTNNLSRYYCRIGARLL